MFQFLDGYKSYLGAALAVVVGALQGFGVIDGEALVPAWSIVAGLFGAGVAGKMQKIADGLSSTIKPGG